DSGDTVDRGGRNTRFCSRKDRGPKHRRQRHGCHRGFSDRAERVTPSNARGAGGRIVAHRSSSIAPVYCVKAAPARERVSMSQGKVIGEIVRVLLNAPLKPVSMFLGAIVSSGYLLVQGVRVAIASRWPKVEGEIVGAYVIQRGFNYRGLV